MNYIKLNELAAQAMGWELKSEISPWFPQQGEYKYWEGVAGEGRRFIAEWNPAGNLNDANTLLEKVANGKGWLLQRNGDTESAGLFKATGKPWFCSFHAATTHGINGYMETAALAMSVCALRASGIPESSITEATKDE